MPSNFSRTEFVVTKMLLDVALLALLVTAASPAQAAPAQQGATATAPGDLPVSLSRIRAGLERPSTLRIIPDTRADFKVEVNEVQRFQDLLDLLDFGSGPAVPGGLYGYEQQRVIGQQSQPLFNIGLSGLGHSIGTAVGKARRERAERLAREEVRHALDDFCATHECPVK
jgi:hypothetical protein